MPAPSEALPLTPAPVPAHALPRAVPLVIVAALVALLLFPGLLPADEGAAPEAPHLGRTTGDTAR